MTWWAVYSRPNAERSAVERVQRIAQVFYPHVVEVKRHRRLQRSWLRTIEKAYFSRYFFVKCPAPLYDIRETPDVSAIVACQGEPLAIPDAVIESIASAGDVHGCMGKYDFTKRQYPKLRIGQMVTLNWPNRILNGLIGELASVARLQSHNEVSVFVQLLGARREVSVPIGIVKVAPAVGTG